MILWGRENIVSRSGKQGNTDFRLFARGWQNFAHTLRMDSISSSTDSYFLLGCACVWCRVVCLKVLITTAVRSCWDNMSQVLTLTCGVHAAQSKSGQTEYWDNLIHGDISKIQLFTQTIQLRWRLLREKKCITSQMQNRSVLSSDLRFLDPIVYVWHVFNYNFNFVTVIWKGLGRELKEKSFEWNLSF